VYREAAERTNGKPTAAAIRTVRQEREPEPDADLLDEDWPPTAEPASPPPAQFIPPAPAMTEAEREQAKRDSERRAAITNLRSVLTYLVSTSITPAQLAANDYAVAVDEFKQEDLDYAAATMSEIAALKETR
jgi:hypothetical protein